MAEYGGSTAFKCPKHLLPYYKSNKINATNVDRTHVEANWRATRTNAATYKAIERCLRKFFVYEADDTWIRKIKHTRHYYMKGTINEIIDHLKVSCLGTHAIDALSLQITMRDYHLKAEGAPEYIIILEDA